MTYEWNNTSGTFARDETGAVLETLYVMFLADTPGATPSRNSIPIARRRMRFACAVKRSICAFPWRGEFQTHERLF